MRFSLLALTTAVLAPTLAQADAAIFDDSITLVPPGREVSQVSLDQDPAGGLAMAWVENGVGFLRRSLADGTSAATVEVDGSIAGHVVVQLDGLGGGLVDYVTTDGSGRSGRRILPGEAALGPVFSLVPEELPPATSLEQTILAPNGEILQIARQSEGCISYLGCYRSRLHARVLGPDDSERATSVLFEVVGFGNLETDGGRVDIVAVPDGPFLMIYERELESDPDADIHAVVIGRDASLEAGPFRVNSYTPGDQRAARLALTPDGGFVAVWQSEDTPGSSPADRTILARRFDPAGLPYGPDFQVVADIASNITRQQSPSVTVAPEGDFLVRWTANDDLGIAQESQLFDAGGARVDEVFRPHPGGYDEVLGSGTVAVGPGRFFTTWSLRGPTLSPPGPDRVEGRTIQRVPWDRIFRDDFEVPDLLAWDEVVEGATRR